jgi:hypothetical protein
MDDNQKIALVNEGRTSSILLEQMGPIFERCETELIQSMKAVFMQGKYDESVLVSHVSQLVAIDKLKDHIKQKVNAGERAFADLEPKKGAPDEYEFDPA